jgi:hypothetical protein
MMREPGAGNQSRGFTRLIALSLTVSATAMFPEGHAQLQLMD